MYGHQAEACSLGNGGVLVGLTYVTVNVSDLAREGVPFEQQFLVDTGSVDCLAPRDKLLAAGIKPERKEVYELANGQSVECDIGFARIRFLGNDTISQFIFGQEGVEPLLGVLALESVGVVVDPNTKNLKRLHAKPLK